MENLPKEMVEKIFEFQEPNDLARMSLTCEFYKTCAEDYFKLKFKSSGKITISMAAFHFEPGEFERYEVRFRSLIRNIQVEIEEPNEIHTAFQFIRDNCAEQLRWLGLYGPTSNQVTINSNQMNILTNAQLASLEILIMYGCVIDDAALPQRLPNLKVLCIEMHFSHDINGTWMNQTFEKVHTLWLLCAEGQININNFLQQNPQIDFVFTNNLAAVRDILSINRKLSKAAIRFWRRHEFPQILGEYENCCKQGNILSLDVCFDCFVSTESLQEIVRLKYVKSLHYQLNDIIMPYFNEMDIQPNLEQLCLRVQSFYSESEVQTIIKCFPNLLELRLDLSCGSFRQSMVDIIKVIIGKMANLRHLYVIPGEVIALKQANDLNSARLNLANAAKVTIHLKKDLLSDLNLTTKWDAVAFECKQQIDCPICDAKGKGYTERCLERLT